ATASSGSSCGHSVRAIGFAERSASTRSVKSRAYSRTLCSSPSSARVSSQRSCSRRSSTTGGSNASRSTSSCSRRCLIHQSGSWRSGSFSGFPAPGRSSKSPRAIAWSMAPSMRADSGLIAGRHDPDRSRRASSPTSELTHPESQTSSLASRPAPVRFGRVRCGGGCRGPLLRLGSLGSLGSLSAHLLHILSSPHLIYPHYHHSNNSRAVYLHFRSSCPSPGIPPPPPPIPSPVTPSPHNPSPTSPYPLHAILRLKHCGLRYCPLSTNKS